MKKYIIILIAVLFVVFGIYVINYSTHSIDYTKRSLDDWYNDVTSNKDVVTVIGASFCGHCQEYKPYITELAKKKKINLYFYEIDTLDEINKDKLVNSFDLIDYNEQVPFTIIFKNGGAVATHEGFESELYIYDFLKGNGIV